MRPVTEDMAERLSARTTNLCLCWRFERRDGQVFGATDHDRALVIEGVTYEPAKGLAAARLNASAGLAPSQAAIDGAFDAGFLDAGSLAAGVWDGARVDVWRIDWTDPNQRWWIWAGRLSDVTLQGEAFHAELVSLKADLERPVGRVYGRTCDAQLGDARCRADLSDAGPNPTCDKRFATCSATYDNAVNFRGFPHMPGPDAVLAGPGAARS
jgi:hypothetical protein